MNRSSHTATDWSRGSESTDAELSVFTFTAHITAEKNFYYYGSNSAMYASATVMFIVIMVRRTMNYCNINNMPGCRGAGVVLKVQYVYYI